jgi:hypothetical protein
MMTQDLGITGLTAGVEDPVQGGEIFVAFKCRKKVNAFALTPS